MPTLQELLFTPDIKRCFLLEWDNYNPNKTHLAKTDISFVAADKSINSTSTNLALYEVADKIFVRGSGSNDTTTGYTVVSASATKVIVEEALVDESAGASIKLYAVQALLFTDAEYAYITKPWESPANVYYDNRLETPASIERGLGGDLDEARGTQSDGDVVLNNADGALDFLFSEDWGGDGREARLLVGQPDGLRSTFYRVNTFLVEQAVLEGDNVVLKAKDKNAEFSKLIQNDRYAGTNSGSTGNEGLPNDLKGKPKVLCYGECYNVPLAPINATADRYAAHSAPMKSFDDVRDGGLTVAGHTPTLASGYTTLTSPPAREVTADVKGDCPFEVTASDISASASDNSFNSAGAGFSAITQGMAFKVSGFTDPANNGYFYVETKSSNSKIIVSNKTLVNESAGASITVSGYVDTVPTIVQRILVTRGDKAWPADFDAAAWVALTDDKTQRVGLFIQDETDIDEACNMLADSIGAKWMKNKADKLTMFVLDAPSAYGSPAQYLTDQEIKEVEILEDGGQTKGIPVKQVALDYKPLWRTQGEGELVSGVSSENKKYFATEIRTAFYPSSPDVDISEAHKNSQVYKKRTLLVDATEADAEAQRLYDLLKVRRLPYSITLLAPVFEYDINTLLNIQAAGRGLDDGKDVIIIYQNEEADLMQVTLHVWG